MKNLFVSKRFSIIALFAVISVGFTYAESNTYYAKVRASVGSTGEGKVYASANTTNNPNYTAAGNTAEKEQNNDTDFTFYMYAKADDGYDFTGWSTSANGSPLSNSAESPYSYSVSSNAESKDAATENNLYAIFRPLPTFYFSATAVVVPNGAGTASVSPAVTNVYGEHWNSTSATTNAITFTATSGANHVFQGWSKTESGEIESSANPYKPTITSNSTNSGSPSNTTLYARFLPYPTGVTASPASMILGEGDSETINAVVTPSGSYSNIGFESSKTSVATVNANGVVTAVSGGEATITVKAFKSDGVTVIATAIVSVSVIEKCANPVIVFEPSSDGKTATTTLSTTTEDASIYYTIDGGEPSISSTSTLYTGPFIVSNGQTVRAITVKPECKESEVTTSTFVATKVAIPSIDVASNGVSFSCETPGVSYFYTTNGDVPTTALTPWNGTPITGLSEGTTIKVIAAKSGMIPSDMASKIYYPATGVSGSVVTLNDYEDHNWTYYQPSGNLPTGYPTTYLSSPNPRNVKITYKGGEVSGASVVAISDLEGEGQNMMVYYKTLEKSVPGMTGDYPYTVISNPFSKRPRTNGSTGTNGFWGFAGWELISGGEYIDEYDNGQTLPLDATIHFTNLDNNYTPNCTSGEVVFKATWTQATVKTGNSAQSFNNTGTYETNFWVLSGNDNIGNITVPGNCTVSSRYPDGTVNFTRNLTGSITAGDNNAKVEFVNMNSTGNVSAANYTFTMGRGIVNSGNGGQLQGCTRDDNCVQTVKVESGTYSSLYHFTNTLNSSRECDQFVILGCDYDRAKSDNNKLKITGAMYLANAKTINRASGVLFARSNIKSGTFQKTITGTYSGTADQSYYFGCYGSNNRSAGHRYMLVEGGDIRGLCGGTDHTTNQQAGDPAFTLRIRGSENNPIVNGIIYGAAENADCRGRRTMVLTGGTVKGWIAGGANGTESSGGTMTGATFIYVGGNANINSEGSQTVINRAVGGNVFGAGCGNSSSSNSGQVTLGTNVVIADKAYVERGVYGGGSYGFCATSQTSNIYITGGVVDGKSGGVNGQTYNANIAGGVYGGACQNKGGTVNIIMNDGIVNGSVYGGSNYTGTLSGTSTVTMNGGTINGSLYGGGNGEGNANTNVNGAVQVRVYGGTVTEAVYGCNNNAGSPQGSVTVDIYGTDPAPAAGQYALYAVYGGGNKANYNGTPAVTIYKCDNSIGYVYGGANAASVTGTKVVIWGGNKIGNVFGGGHGYMVPSPVGADVNGDVSVTIYGGTIGKVFGGSNTLGNITGGINLTINKEGECHMHIDEVYGGGNEAAGNAGIINIGCTGGEDEGIGDVYGGANAADINSDITLNITGGNINNVFGGNNTSGNILGKITVNVENTGACGLNVNNVYGAGNKAPYGSDGNSKGNYPQVNIKSGIINENVYGGGLGESAVVYGNPQVRMTGARVGNVFGGGNAAEVKGNTNVNITGGNVLHNVYGGGNQANVTGQTNVVIGQ